MVFDETISRVQGMYFVRPEVVPDVTAKKGTRVGQVVPFRCGNGSDQ